MCAYTIGINEEWRVKNEEWLTPLGLILFFL